MSMKKCEICGQRPATVPDRDRPGRLINRICSECHRRKLSGDLKVVVAKKARESEPVLPVFIHTPLGWITQAPSERWLGYLEIAPRSDANGPEAPIMQIEGRTREQLLRRMLDEARCQMRLLGTMISWAENQEWARRGKK